MLSQPALDWKAPDRGVVLLNFEMEVANILQMKKLVRQTRASIHTDYYQHYERQMQKCNRNLQCAKRKIQATSQ